MRHEETRVAPLNDDWPNTLALYHEWLINIKESVETDIPRYGDFFNALMADLCMEAPDGLEIETEQDFVIASNLLFPKDSEAFEWSRKIIGLRILGLGKNEFIACKNRNDCGNDSKILWKLRSELEYNPDFIQIIAIALPYIRIVLDEGSEHYVFLFVKESLSDMAGHTTMIGGHIRYSPNISSMTFDATCNSMARVEFCEETGLRNNTIEFAAIPQFIIPPEVTSTIGSITFNTVREVDENCISHYHIGYGYPLQILRKEAIPLMELEKGKDIVLWTPSVGPVLTKDNPLFDFRDSVNHRIPLIVGDEILSREFNVDNWVEFFVRHVIRSSSIYYTSEYNHEG